MKKRNHLPGRRQIDVQFDEDEALLQRFVSGDDGAFEKLVQRYQDRMYRLARIYFDSSNAEDAAQEIFVQLFRSAKKFDGRSTLRTWIYGIGYNVCRNRFRREAKTRIDYTDCDIEVQDPKQDPFSDAIKAEWRKQISRCAQELPVIQVEVLQLRDWDGLTYQDIAEILEIPLGTVRSRLHAARAALARSLSIVMEKSAHEL